MSEKEDRSEAKDRCGKRPAEQKGDTAGNPKRRKGDVELDLICPITHELPFDPVMAEDGRVYERNAIQEYFDGKEAALVKSPMTNQMISKTLIALP